MALSEKYQPVSATRIQGFTHDHVQGTNAIIPTAPFLDGHIPEFSVVGVSAEEEVLESDTNLRKISSIHGRSYELLVEKWNGVVWADEYGNVFSHLNTKGNNCTNPQIGKSDIAPSGYIVYGMQDSDSMVRVLRASDLLRSQNVDTEAIIKVIEPAELPYDGVLTPLPEFKKKLIKAIWENNSPGLNFTHFTPPKREEMPQVVKALDNMTLFITIRGVQVNERLEDITKADSFAEIVTILSNAFKYINRVEKLKATKDSTHTPESFSLGNSDDIIRYCNEYLPKRMATNLAGFHKLELIHYFPHSGNISTVGSFYDLDSVQGEPLGDYDVTIHDITQDVNKCIDGYTSGFSKPGVIVRKLGGDDDEFRENFINNYVEEMGWVGDITKFSAICNLVAGHQVRISEDDSKDVIIDPDLYKYMDRIIEQEKIKYAIDLKEITPFILQSLRKYESISRHFTRDQKLKHLTSSLKEVVEQAIIRDFEYKHPQASLFEKASVEFFSKVFSALQQQNIISEVNQTLQEEGTNYATQDSESLEETALQREAFYTELVKRWGWEEDVPANINLIDLLFDGFHAKNQVSYLDYYCKKLSDQLGWDFNIPETRDDLSAMFYAYDQEVLRGVIENALSASFEAEDTMDVIQATLKQNDTGEDYTWDHVSRRTAFGVDLVWNKFTEQFGDKLEELEEKYGEETVEIIVDVFQKRELNRLINFYPKGEDEKIEIATEERIKALINEFLLRLP